LQRTDKFDSNSEGQGLDQISNSSSEHITDEYEDKLVKNLSLEQKAKREKYAAHFRRIGGIHSAGKVGIKHEQRSYSGNMSDDGLLPRATKERRLSFDNKSDGEDLQSIKKEKPKSPLRRTQSGEH
jgi:hypothetical protein